MSNLLVEFAAAAAWSPVALRSTRTAASNTLTGDLTFYVFKRMRGSPLSVVLAMKFWLEKWGKYAS